MNNFYNDPLGALSKGLTVANSTIKTNVASAADKIKNNENLKSSLASAKDKAAYGLHNAGAYAGDFAQRVNHEVAYRKEQNYHGRAMEGAQNLTQTLKQKVKGGVGGYQGHGQNYDGQ